MPFSSISKLFGIAVRSRRLSAGLSQELLAERANLHPTYISMVERGVRNATLDAAARIAGALNVSLPKLIDEAQRQRATRAKKEKDSRNPELTTRGKAERLSRPI
jgi:transcriptional regulator with XRE-family HTH domain